ncbi:MAG TPA: CRTAC1 family protein, partial [Terriglobales bacterium]
ITDEAGISLRGMVSVGAAFADIDNDGDQDLVITTVRKGVHLFENDGHGHFKDISKEAGINVAAHAAGAFFFDYDRDGLVDLLICNVGRFTTDKVAADGSYVGVTDAFAGQMFPDRYERTVLYKNLGHNRFKDVTAEVGLTPQMWSGDATFADLNGDGWPDLYLLNMQGDDHYYENQNGKRFIEKTSRYFPKTPWGSMGVKFFDFDNDGRLDLLITDMHSDMSEDVGSDKEKLKSNIKFPPAFLMTHGTSIFGNALYHNAGNGKFEEVSDGMGVETYWPWGVSVADLNADGWEDIFVTGGMGYPFRYGVNSVLLNNRGEKFLDSEFLLGIEPRRDGRTHAFSFQLDCGQPQHGRAQQLCLGKSGKIDVMGTLSSRSSVVFDLDDDGDLDIVTNDFNSEPMVLISDLSDHQPIHWIKIALEGTTSNRDGIGAIVRVHAGTRVYMKQNDGKSGYLAQSALPLYFGLGEATTVDSIEVEWPSGQKQIVDKNIAINTTLRITEAKSPDAK